MLAESESKENINRIQCFIDKDTNESNGIQGESNKAHKNSLSQKRRSSCKGHQDSTSSAVTKDSLCVSDSSMAEALSAGYGISFFFSVVWL